MEKVFSLDDVPWKDLTGLRGARGFEFKALTGDVYTKAHSCELVRLEPGDHSVPHIEPWSHLLYFSIFSAAQAMSPSTAALRRYEPARCVKFAPARSIRCAISANNDMLVLTIYDPPRVRKEDQGRCGGF